VVAEEARSTQGVLEVVEAIGEKHQKLRKVKKEA
jgi:hypothetical protein